MDIVLSARDANSLIILPTGLGKTFIKIMLIAVLKPTKKVLLFAPTKPLCDQHVLRLQTLLPKMKTGLITGEVSVKNRQIAFDQSNIIVATPQTMVSGKDKSADWSLAENYELVFIDEVHHTKGKYDYVSMAQYYKNWRSFVGQSSIRLYGFTASVSELIAETELVRKNIGVDIHHVIGRTIKSEDVLPYLFAKEVKPIYLDDSPPKLLRDLRALIFERLFGYFKVLADKHDLLEAEYFYCDKKGLAVGFNINKFMALNETLLKGGNQPDSYQDKVDWGLIMRFYTAVSMADKGLSELSHYLIRQVEEVENSDSKHRSKIRFVDDDVIINVIGQLYQNRLWGKHKLPQAVVNLQLQQCEDTKRWLITFDDAKIRAIDSLISQSENKKVMIFFKYRDTLQKIKYFIEHYFPNRSCFILIGTDKNSGHEVIQNHEQQKKSISDFAQTTNGVMLATSIGEEGLDSPSVDWLIMYEPVGSIIRDVQRKGRAGRHAPASIYILIYKLTAEDYIYRSLFKKEAQVEKILNYYQQKNRQV